MYLLDTVSNNFDKRRGNERLHRRMEQASPETIWISIITFEEILKGILNLLNQARKHPRNAIKIVEYYGLLQSLAHDLGSFPNSTLYHIDRSEISGHSRRRPTATSTGQPYSSDCTGERFHRNHL